jgi:hypothetical protein
VKQSRPIQTWFRDQTPAVNLSCGRENVDRYSFLSWASILLGMFILACHAAGLNDPRRTLCQVTWYDLGAALACPQRERPTASTTGAFDASVASGSHTAPAKIVPDSDSAERSR